MLEKLKEYKELLAIVVFFLGGVFWLQDQYPSKQDLKAELKSVRCLLDNYMKLTQLQIFNQEQDKRAGLLARKVTEASPDSGNELPVSPAMKAELEQLRAEFTSVSSLQGKTASEMAAIRDELERGVCGRVDL
jgi:hypothetical protein